MAAGSVIFWLVVALAVGQVTGWRVIDQLALVISTLLITAWVWSRLSLRGVTVERSTTTDRGQVGQPLVERLELRNAGRLAKLWLEVIDYSTLPNHQVSRAVAVSGRRRVGWQVETYCVRRGRFRLGPLALRSGDPLGIFTRRRHIADHHEILVYPATVDLTGFPAPIGHLTGGAALDRRSPFVTPSVAGVRDYSPGDGYNRISWGATARLGRLMVKEFDLDPTADVWLILDLDANVHLAANRPLGFFPEARTGWPVEAWLDSTTEYAVTIVASLARRFLDQGRNVGLICTGAHYDVIAADRSRRQEIKMLEALAVVRADGHLPLGQVLVAEARRFTRHSSLVVVTPSTAETWVRALAEITGRRVRGTAILVEPETFGQAPSSLLAVSGLAAAGIPTHLIKYGDTISAALSMPSAGVVAGASRG